MIDGLKPLGSAPQFEVNARWQIARLWEVSSPRLERNKSDLELLSVFLGRGVILYGQGGGQVHKPSMDLSNYQVVYPGDLVLNNQQAWRGSVGVSKYLGIISPAYVVLKLAKTLNPSFSNYLFRSGIMVNQFVTASKGVGDIQRDIYTPWLKNVRVPIPPLPEQSAIVRFLNHADGRIQRYIRAKRKFIKLLQEQKQAIIHHAVTRGLDPNVRLKPSGVQWLGEVPEHWKVLPIKRAFVSMVYGISESATDGGTVRLLTMGHIQDGGVMVPSNGGIVSADPMLLLQEHDLLFNRTNSAELVGKVGLFKGAETEVTFASYLVRMRPRNENDAEFLNLLLNDSSVLSAARREAIPSLHQSNLNPTRYGRLYIALPQLSEQQAIVRFLKDATTNLNQTIDRTRREINLLREYRTRLIADVVTGKFDVREAAASLPKETDEPEPLDDTGALVETDEQMGETELAEATEEAEA